MAIIVDCETYRIDTAADYLEPIVEEPVKADGRLTDPAKIAADIEKKAAAEAERVRKARQQQLDDCALNPYLARIIALGWSLDDGRGPTVDAVWLAKTELEEAIVLQKFWAQVVDDSGYIMPIVGFNSIAFDLPLMLIRSRLLGVRAPALSLDRWRSPHPDLMRILSYNEALRFPKGQGTLRWFARRFGLPMDDAFSGAEIAQLVESDNWDAIRAHCAWDVRTCKALAEKFDVIRRRPS